MGLLCPAIFHVSVFILFLGGIFRQFGGIFYNVRYKLLEVKRILFCDNRLALILMSCIRIQLSALQIFRIIIFLFCINRLRDLFFLSRLLFLIISLLWLYRFLIFNKVTFFFHCF